MSIVRASLPALLAALLTMASLAIGVRWPAPDFSGPIGDGSGYARTRAWFRTTGFQDPSYDAASGRQFSWTAARARIIVPEIDRSRAYRMTLRIAAARSAEMPPPPTIAVSVDGAPALAAQTTNDAADYTVDIPAGQARRLVVAIDAGNTFLTPPPDQRTLGVVVENIRLQPVDAGFAPTWTTLLLAGVASMAMVAALSLCGFGPVWALVCAGVVTVVNVGLLRLDGAFLGTFATDLAEFGLASVAAGIGVIPLRRVWPGRGLFTDWPLAAGLTLLAITLKLAIFQHPQAQIGDAVFHVHRAQNVVGGNYFFTSITPKPYFEFPYAVALYVAALPFWSWAPTDPAKVHLLRGLAIVADALVVFAMFFPLRAAAGRWAAVCFGVLYPVVPITAQALGAANLTNVFGQGVFGTAMGAISVLATGSATTIAGVGIAAALLAVAFLSHFSTASVGVPLVGLVGTLISAGASRAARRVGVLVLVALVMAGTCAYGLYYSHFHAVYRATFARVTSGEGKTETQSLAAPVAVKAGRFRYELGLNFTWPLLAVAAIGAGLRVRRHPRDPFTLVLVGWLWAWLIFAVLGILTAIEMRANLAAAPLVAAFAALALGDLGGRSPRAAVAAGLIAAGLAITGAGALLAVLGT